MNAKGHQTVVRKEQHVGAVARMKS